MCARYELLTTLESVVAGLALRIPPNDEQARRPRAFERGEVRPTNLAPVVMPDRSVGWLPWGLAVEWQNQPVINARSETLDSKPTFRPLLNQRCLVPATAYFEWRAAGRDKIKTRIRTDGEVFAFAGLVGAGRFTIATCTSAASITHIHDRMPVILDRAAQALWLSAQPFAEVKHVLQPYTQGLTFEELIAPKRQGELAL
jgi:putative SOS response-associated peptidase YedK